MTGQNRDQNDEIVVYEAPNGDAQVEVLVGSETVWLTLKQMADLFDTTSQNVGIHISNAYAEGELEEGATTKDSFVVRLEGNRSVRRRVSHYSLDMIISVGYRVKSKHGTQFRIWANQILRDHLLRGHTLNEKRLLARGVEFDQVVALLSSTLHRTEALTTEGSAVLDVIQHYARTWRMLEAYDEGRLPETPEQTSEPLATLDIQSARQTIGVMRGDIISRGEDPGMFGQERGDTLEGILLGVEQTWDGVALYPTIESRASHLLYFIIKDHPFSDGNKRTGSLLFLDYLRRNNALLGTSGQPRFSDTALVALALLVAESEASQKDVVIRVILNLLAEDRP
jgi:prophage maintenance system killer protein